MPKVVVAEFMDDSAVRRLRVRVETHYDPGLADRPAALADLLQDADALIVRNRVEVRGELLAGAVRLTCVGRLGVGLDNIDLDACRRRGIAVYPATGANRDSVAEYVVAAMLLLFRGAWTRSAEVAAGAWPREAAIGHEASGRTLGLLGLGSIARATATRARALGMTVLAADPHVADDDPVWSSVGRRSVDDVFREADAVSLHVPLAQDTRHLANARRLALMRPGSVLINTARGGVVDEDALVGALASGQIAGAALDVFETEPLTAEMGARFRGLNVFLTPHIAGVTVESNVRTGNLIAERILERLAA